MKQRLRQQFRLAVIGQIIALIGTVSILAWTALATEHIAVPAVVVLVVLLQVFVLLRTVEKHVDTLEDFFAAINYEDLTRKYVTDDIDAELKTAFNRIIDRFRVARAERELQAGYLETVVRHVPIPLMAVRSDGSLRLTNNPLKRLTGLNTMTSIDDFGRLDAQLPGMLKAIDAGQQRLLQSRFRDIPVELRVAVAEVRIEGNTERIYSIENLSGELSARESSAWRNLIRVLTHEIMNTLTPVASLAETAVPMTGQADAKDELRDAIETIARRSRGLIGFVERYRELLQLPRPQPELLSVSDMLNGVVRLMSDELQDVDVTVAVEPQSLEVRADPVLIDQVLVNLVRNAAQAMAGTDSPTLELRARLDYGRIVVQVADNGAGIPDEIADQVFVPFFTTKRDGSGIGLSVSRQIMMAHGGELAAASGEDGTTMSLLF